MGGGGGGWGSGTGRRAIKAGRKQAFSVSGGQAVCQTDQCTTDEGRWGRGGGAGYGGWKKTDIRLGDKLNARQISAQRMRDWGWGGGYGGWKKTDIRLGDKLYAKQISAQRMGGGKECVCVGGGGGGGGEVGVGGE